MQNLNHQVWGKIKRFNQKAAIVVVIVFCMSLFSMLSVSLARQFMVFYNRKCQIVTACTQNPKTIMKKAGIQVTGSTEYEMEETEEGPVLRVGPECNLKVVVDGQTKEMVSRTDRVETVLNELGITLGEYDEVTPALDTIFTEDTTITVQRIVYKTVSRVEEIAPVVVYEDTDTLPKGATKVKKSGSHGEQLATYAEKLVDGEVVQSRHISTMAMKDAQPKVMLRGTADPQKFVSNVSLKSNKKNPDAVVTNNANVNKRIISPLEPKTPIAVNEKGQPLNYKKCITGLATAYTGGEGGWRTATGERVQVGYVAVDPREIPYGTMLFIRTKDGRYMYGLAKAADTGGFINGPVTVDLFFDTHAECTQFGVRDVEIYVL